MGCSCTSNQEPKKKEVPIEMIQEPMTNAIRYAAYKIPSQEENYILTFDFQTRESQITKVVINPEISDYTVFMSHPLLFIAGGIEKGSGELSKKIWMTSACEGTISMSGSKNMNEPCRLPFLVSNVDGGIVYVVGGQGKQPGEYLTKCEKTRVGDDIVTPLKPMNRGHDFIVGIGKYIYALSSLQGKEMFERFDMEKEMAGWSMKALSIPESYSKYTVGLSKYGVIPADTKMEKLLIFGGIMRDKKSSAAVFLLDGETGEVTKDKNSIPEAEDFFTPAIAGKENCYILTRSFKLLVCQRMTLTWTPVTTSIFTMIRQKELHLNP